MKQVLIFCVLAISLPAGAQTPDAAVKRIVESAEFKQATAFIEGDYDRFVRELIALTEIPAPPFKEAARAKAYLAMLQASGLSDVEMDAEGNAMGVRKGTGGGSMVRHASMTSGQRGANGHPPAGGACCDPVSSGIFIKRRFVGSIDSTEPSSMRV